MRIEPNDADMKLCIIMVGLPARGKSFISHQLDRYLNWIGLPCKVFNVGKYRRVNYGTEECGHNFFDFTNPLNLAHREELAQLALSDTVDWLKSFEGKVGIFDATNVTYIRRKNIYENLTKNNITTFFVESICDDNEILNNTIETIKAYSPDYIGVEKEKAKKDFIERIRLYQNAYISINEQQNESHYSYIKIYNAGLKFEINRPRDYLQHRIIQLLMNQHIKSKTIYLSRRGESKLNEKGTNDVDSCLSKQDLEFAKNLIDFFDTQDTDNVQFFTSFVQRNNDTSQFLSFKKYSLSNLKEVKNDNFVFSPYNNIQQNYPDINNRQRNKCNLIYPPEESYDDIYNQIEPLILEFERFNNIFVISHDSVIRTILSYYLNISRDKTSCIQVPLHHLIKLTRTNAEYKMELYKISLTEEQPLIAYAGNEINYIN